MKNTSPVTDIKVTIDRIGKQDKPIANTPVIPVNRQNLNPNRIFTLFFLNSSSLSPFIFTKSSRVSEIVTFPASSRINRTPNDMKLKIKAIQASTLLSYFSLYLVMNSIYCKIITTKLQFRSDLMIER